MRICVYGLLMVILVLTGSCEENQPRDQHRPNVIIVITDDQGYGDIGFHGNPHIQTPTLDAFASESIRFTNFYVSPVCAPTRSSLMTGRYSLRTGVRDTYNGGAIMATSEVTIAELLKDAGYVTGIFGKWHLGDNYPSRAMDQGFDESVVHLSGGMGQVGDFTTYYERDSSYFNPILWNNGQQTKYTGYCSDIFANEAINFIRENHNQPFFCYLSFNAPHTPLQVPDEYYQKYADLDPSAGFDELRGMSESHKEAARRVYGMVTNIDDNMSKLLGLLKELNIVENTLVIFMTDNGPQQVRFNGGMKGRKGSVYRGGVRVPFYLRYPAGFSGNQDIDFSSAHIDVLPTVAGIVGLDVPKDRIIDGVDLTLIIEEQKEIKRDLFFYWTRKYPELYNNIALQTDKYRFVGMTDYDAELKDFELHEIERDPGERENVIEANIQLAGQMKQRLDSIYYELIQSENIKNQPPIIIGSENEPVTFLNRNDASGQRGIWNQEILEGQWIVEIEEGWYNFRFNFVRPITGDGKMILETNTINQKHTPNGERDFVEMNDVFIPEFKGAMIPRYYVDGKGYFPFLVEIKKIR